MVHILLVILKIVGILLLVILLVALLAVLAVLLVPLRYRVCASYIQRPCGYVRVTWLLHLLSYRAEYGEAGLVQKLRVFGFCLWRSGKTAGEADDGAESVLSDEEQALYRELKEDEEARTAGMGDGLPGERGARKPEAGSREAEFPEASDAGRPEGASGTREPEEATGAQSGTDGPQKTPPPESFARNKKPGPAARMIGKMKGLIEKLRFSFRAFCDKLKNGRALFDTACGWIGDEKNKSSVRLLARQLKRAVTHVLPRRGHASVTLGFDDPYTTGQVLAVAGPFYPLYHRVLEIHPVFDRAVFSGEGDLRGRIRLITLLWLCFQVYRDKHTWNLICKFRK